MLRKRVPVGTSFIKAVPANLWGVLRTHRDQASQVCTKRMPDMRTSVMHNTGRFWSYSGS